MFTFWAGYVRPSAGGEAGGGDGQAGGSAREERR